MAKNKKSKKNQPKQIIDTISGSRLKTIDRLLIFRFFRLLHGRFWGFGGLISILLGAIIGYAIRPDLFAVDVALSKLGTDVRTAPFFSGSMFFAAYSLWRWRVYLTRTFKNTKPVFPLISLTILGLYLIALVPVTWEVWPHRIHNFGVVLTGISMSATVLADSLLNATKYTKHKSYFRAIKLLSFFSIVVGGLVVIASVRYETEFNYILAGEAAMFFGYGTWVTLKIYLGEGKRSTIGRIFHRLTN